MQVHLNVTETEDGSGARFTITTPEGAVTCAIPAAEAVAVARQIIARFDAPVPVREFGLPAAGSVAMGGAPLVPEFAGIG